MHQSPGQRVVIIGSSGSGKSTLAECLAMQRGLPFIELDALHWEPGWTPAEPAVFRERVRQAIQPDAWVMAGNYSQQQDLSWARADTVVWLDLGLFTVLRRCVRRTWRRWRTNELLWGTNYESLWDNLKLWDVNGSLFSYTIVHHRRRRRKYESVMLDPDWSHLTFIRLRSQKDIDRWLATTVKQPR